MFYIVITSVVLPIILSIIFKKVFFHCRYYEHNHKIAEQNIILNESKKV